MNCSWATQVDNIYTRNPHLLRDPPPHIQANVAANLLKVHRKSPQREENSSPFTHLDSFNEEDEELGLLGGKNNTNKIQLDRYIKVLQIKRKEMDIGKKTSDLLTSAAKINWFGLQMHPQPKIPILCQKLGLPQLSHF